MKVLALEHGDQNTAAIDPWTAVHLATGLASGLLGFSLLGSLAAAAAYEVAEQAAERTELGRSVFQTNGPESAANVAVDLLVFLHVAFQHFGSLSVVTIPPHVMELKTLA